ncbi:hypothetical protein [Arthrobacter sp. Br18]|uniref:hypothetical protein n=1 Tax=Arthrobacter sp. Br18 TaxID=1312954 RepID=UPI00138ACCE6|nr:hypothetical protein [Arthrobacter sp. Br18]
MVRVYVEGPNGAHVFDADESSTYNSSVYGQVRPAVLVFLDGELHVYGTADQQAAAGGGYVVSFDGGVLRIGGSNDHLIRAYAPGAWQQVYEHPLLHRGDARP